MNNSQRSAGLSHPTIEIIIKEPYMLDEDVASILMNMILELLILQIWMMKFKETQEDSNKKVLLTRRSSILVVISILKKSNNEQDLPLYDEIQKLEQEFIQSYKQMNLEQYFLVKQDKQSYIFFN